MIDASRGSRFAAGVVAVVLAIGAAVPACRGARDASALGPAARIRVAWEQTNRTALRNGVIPLWNPYSFGGRPHYADMTTQVLYPPHLALTFLPPHRMFPVSFAFHLWLAGLGTFLVARRLTRSVVPSLLAAAAVMLAGTLGSEREYAYAGTVDLVAWLPIIVLCSWRSAERRSVVPPPVLVVTVACAVLASPRGGAYALAAILAGYCLAAVETQTATRLVWAQALWLATLAGGLGAVQTLPALQYWASTLRYGGLAVDVPNAESHHDRDAKGLWLAPDFVRQLTTLDGRVISTCPRLADASQLGANGVRLGDGYGGGFLADEARFVHMALGGEFPRAVSYAGMTGAGTEAARADLLPLLDADYLLACDAPNTDDWVEVSEFRTRIEFTDFRFRTRVPVPARKLSAERRVGGLYRAVRTRPRAFWTCGPEAGSCDEIRPAQVIRADQIDGGMLVAVDAPRDGIVFFSETFYPVRAAYVDGSPAGTRKVNLAFTAVPVRAGLHRVELRYDRLPVVIGAGVSVATLCAWLVLLLRGRGRQVQAA